MSYKREDFAVDTLMDYAGTDIGSLDPDECYALLRDILAAARDCRDGFDENGDTK